MQQGNEANLHRKLCTCNRSLKPHEWEQTCPSLMDKPLKLTTPGSRFALTSASHSIAEGPIFRPLRAGNSVVLFITARDVLGNAQSKGIKSTLK